MGKVKYDEFQLAKRHRIAYQTLIMLIIMVLINGYVKSSYGVWAEPYLESLVLIYIPGYYFASRSIWQNAYIRANDRPSMLIIMMVLMGFIAAFGLLSLGFSVFSGTFRLVENGQLGGDIGILLMSLLFAMMFVLLIVRWWMDRCLSIKLSLQCDKFTE